MNTYFSTFISGFGEVVQTELQKQIPDISIDLLLDGLVVYRSAASVNKIKGLRFLNNSFVLLEKFEKLNIQPMDLMVKRVLQRFNFEKIPESLLRSKKTYRIMFSEENKTVAVDKQKHHKLEFLISQFTRLRVGPSNPDIEFWFLYRREGYGFFGLRLTRHTAYEKTLNKGELRPQLAHLLCLISEPSANEIVLDPFCGWGAIPIERAKSFPYQRILAGDQDSKLVKQSRSKAKRLKNISLDTWNAFNLVNIEDASIDKIVTDPPWGIYGNTKLTDMEVFYTKMLTDLLRVLKPAGLVVILTGAKTYFESALEKFPNMFVLLKRYDVLVSGKKAGVYKLKKL